MNDRTLSRFALCLLGVAALCRFGAAQDAPEPLNQQMDFESKLGAMRFFNADGDVKLNFRGTVLIRDYKGDLTVSGDLKKEYEGQGRIVYFGKGTLEFKGHWTSMQWFGQDLVGSWYGRGGFRLYGDYDKNLDTGWWWVNGNTARKLPWPTQSTTYILPYIKRVRGNQHPLTVKPKGG